MARIGNPNPNQKARLGFGSVKRPRIMRALDPLTYKTLQRGNPPSATTQLDKPEISANQFYQRGRPIIRRRASVRRLFRHDPYNLLSANAPPPFDTGATEATMSPVASQFTNNANPEFHPEQSPGAITVARQPQAAAGTKNRGKVFPPNRQTLFGGKTLRRR